ncbi:MAG: endonuclease domain-containing protein [Alphaproteobacteria bacterium]
MDAPRRTRTFARQLRGAMSLPEVILWQAIRSRKVNGLRFRRQHPFGSYVLDFYCPEFRLCLEVDGASHGLGDRPLRDDIRDARLAAQGIRTLRMSAELVLHDVDDAVRMIRGFLDLPEPLD